MDNNSHRNLADAYRKLGHESRKMAFQYELVSEMHKQMAAEEEAKEQEEGR